MVEAVTAHPSPAMAAPGRVWTWLGRLGAAFLGAVLLVATVAKALDPAAFAERMQAEGLTFGMPPMVAAVLALAIEGGIGLLLVLGVRRLWLLVPASALVAFFLFLNAHTWWLDAHGKLPAGSVCGCFGNAVQRTPAQAFWQDLLMLLPPLLLAFLGRPRSAEPPRRRLAVAAIGTAALALLAWRAPELPLDDVATRLRPGVAVAELCTSGSPEICLDDVASELAAGQGPTWIALVDLAKPEGWVDALNARTRVAGAVPAVALVSPTEADQLFTFNFQWGPSFAIHEAPAALIRPLYRQLPRSFLVEDGKVVRTVSGLPPVGSDPAP